MRKKIMKKWKVRSGAAVLAVALFLESTAVGYAAEMTTKTISSNEIVELQEQSEEESKREEIGENISISENQPAEDCMDYEAQCSEVEECADVEQKSEEEITLFSDSSDFVINENGVLTEYLGTASQVVIPAGVVEIGNSVFAHSSLEKVEFPQGLEKIGERAFQGCESLKEIILPESMQSIGYKAFQECTSLEKVVLNEGLLSIGEEAFLEAALGKLNQENGLVEEGGSLTIPSTVQLIELNAFAGVKGLEEVIFANGNNENLNIQFINNSDRGIFGQNESLKIVTLPERLITVAGKMFFGCNKLESVTLGSKVKAIGEQAFRECESLKEITLPDSTESIEYKAFQDCTSLEKVHLNEGLLSIGEAAFLGAGFGKGDKITGKVTEYGTLTIPSTVCQIGMDAFAETKYLKEVTFVNGINQTLVIEEGNNAYQGIFGMGESLEKVLLPKRMTKLPYKAFHSCYNLKTVYIPKTITNIPREEAQDTFYECDKEKMIIYGEAGSEAEKFADEMGFKFKNSSVLGLFPTGMLLNRRNITLSGETAMGKTYALKATIKPSTAQNKAVSFTSGNSNVASVDKKGIITINGYGETDIVVTSLENDGIFANCHVTVLRQWSEEELIAVREYITENNNFTVIANVYEDLQEVEINAPEGIQAKWRLPYEIGTGVKKYDVVLQKEGYVDAVIEDMEVIGIQVTGVQLHCATQVEPGKTTKAEARLLTKGTTLTENDYQIIWKSSNSSNVSVEETTESALNALISGVKKSSNANVTVKVVLKKDGNNCSTAKADKGITWFETSVKVKVTNYVIVDDITVTAKKEGKVIELSELSELTNLTEKQIYTLTAESFGKGEKVEAPLSWKSSNSGVASVKTAKDGTVTLTVSNKGTAVITAAANKNGGYAESFRVVVKDSTPRLTEKSIAVNLYKIEAAEYVHILPSDGYEVVADSLQIVTSKGDAAPFEISREEGNSYKIKVKASECDKIKTGNHSVKILAKTGAEEEVAHELALKIKVEKKLPKVTIQQGSIVDCENGIWEVNNTPGTVNLYEKEAYGVIWAMTENAEIARVSYAAKDGNSVPRFVEAEETTQSKGVVDAERVLVKAVGTDKSNFSKTKNKGTLTVSFEGYLPEAVYKKDITIAVNKKLPVMTAVAATTTLYPETLADTTEVTLMNKTTKEAVSLTEGYSVAESKMPNGYASKIKPEENLMEIQALNSAKNGNVEYKISHKDWLEGLTVSTKCALKVGKVPTLSFEKAKVTLNAGYTLDVYDAVDTGAYIKGAKSLEWKNITVKGKDKNSEQVLKEKAISVFAEEGKIKAGVADGSYFEKAGNYTFEITAYGDNKAVKGTLKVAVVPGKNKAAITLKAKGTINLLDRENRFVTVTPTVKNYTGKVVDVDLYSAYADKFEAIAEDGIIVIKAQANETIKTKTGYTLHMYVTLDSGVRLPATVKVTPKQTNPKLVQNVKEIVLFETAKGMSQGKTFIVDTMAGQQGVIKQMRLTTPNDTFEFDETTGIVYVKDTASMKPGKKYTLKFEVVLEDAGSNEKPLTVSLKVDYRK